MAWARRAFPIKGTVKLANEGRWITFRARFWQSQPTNVVLVVQKNPKKSLEEIVAASEKGNHVWLLDGESDGYTDREMFFGHSMAKNRPRCRLNDETLAERGMGYF